jgi:ring-1,2-phenylacetyl-CoA epoxidase subunit PaaE
MTSAHFHELIVKRVAPEACGAVVITLCVEEALTDLFRFKPGQFLTLRANVGCQSQRRNYSICSSVQRYAKTHEIDIGIKPVTGGLFSNWAATQLKAGDRLDCMPPDGRFTPAASHPGAKPDDAAVPHRVGFAAGSGITPLLSIMTSTLEGEPDSRFTLVYGNQRVGSIMFNEVLQDLKDKYPTRVSLIHVLSRQAQEADLFNGRLDAGKVRDLLTHLIPANHITEAFVCGPAAMMDDTTLALHEAGMRQEQVHTERFFAGATMATAQPAPAQTGSSRVTGEIQLQVVLDGKTHSMTMQAQDKVLDAALAAGLDLPYACRGGVCCTCRARVLDGQVAMEKNFTLEQWEMDKGFVLTCQARPLTSRVLLSYDER